MMDWTLNKLRYEEMLREAEKRHKVQALMPDRRSRGSGTGILSFVGRALASAQSVVPQPSRMRSRKI